MRISSANTMTRCNSGLQTRGGSCNANSPHNGACVEMGGPFLFHLFHLFLKQWTLEGGRAGKGRC